MNKCGIFIFLIVMLSKVSFAENYQTYNCVAKLHNGSDHSTIKFPLKILKYYGDGYVVFSRENILGEKILVFGRIRNDNELVGYLYDDKFIISSPVTKLLLCIVALQQLIIHQMLLYDLF